MTSLFAALGLIDYAVIAAILILVYSLRSRPVTRADLRRLDRKLNALLKHQGIVRSPIVSEEVERILSDPGRKAEAIRLHGQQARIGAEDAEADVEAYLAGEE